LVNFSWFEIGLVFFKIVIYSDSQIAEVVTCYSLLKATLFINLNGSHDLTSCLVWVLNFQNLISDVRPDFSLIPPRHSRCFLSWINYSVTLNEYGEFIAIEVDKHTGEELVSYFQPYGQE